MADQFPGVVDLTATGRTDAFYGKAAVVGVKDTFVATLTIDVEIGGEWFTDTTITAPGVYVVEVPVATSFSVNVANYTSGTITLGVKVE